MGMWALRTSTCRPKLNEISPPGQTGPGPTVLQQQGADRLCGGLGRHAVLADSQSEGVLHAGLKLLAGDSQHRAAEAEAKVQGVAVVGTLWGRRFKPVLVLLNRAAHLVSHLYFLL